MPTAKRTPRSKKKTATLSLVESRESSASQNKYEVLFDQVSDAIVAITPMGKIDAVNQAFESLAGYLRNDLIGSSLKLFVPNAKKHRIPDRAKILSADLFKTPGVYEDVAVLRADGYVRLVDLSVRFVERDGVKLTLALCRDVTEKKKMERELITKHAELKDAYFRLESQNAELKTMQNTLVQAGKMAALGELAAGIAHELNQPLLGIRGYAQEVKEIVDPIIEGNEQSESIRDFFNEIISNSDKMSKIISHLRSFVRKSVEEYEDTDVHLAIEEALKMLSRQFESRGIQVKKEFYSEALMVHANPLQLEQVFINLATNARDAIEQTKRGDGVVKISTRYDGDFVEIQFQDNGAGMSPGDQKKIFNPFFTTKDVGKGMGLGLSLSYGIMNKLHGSIVAESELGTGTTFTLRLPRDYREVA